MRRTPDPRFLAEGVGLAGAVAWLFYRSLAAFFLLAPLSLVWEKRRSRQKREKEKALLSGQLKEMLGSVVTALRAGRSAENAFREALRDMEYEFGKEAPVCRELVLICRGLDNHMPLEGLVADLAVRAGTGEMAEFAEIFAIARKNGGNLAEILDRTASQIRDRMETLEEIRLMLAGRRMEQTIMDLVPFLIILYISLTSPGFFDVLYGNPAGALFMTVCLAVYLAALAMSEKILDIRV